MTAGLPELMKFVRRSSYSKYPILNVVINC